MSKVVVDPAAHPFLRIAAVSYEGSLFGWNIEENAEQVELSSKLTFGFNVSIGCMKAIAVSESGKYLVVGGMDERIRIYDMHNNKAVGELSQHTASITSLKFFKDSYLISASEDFNLCIWRVYDWQCVHILGGHKDTILDFSIHPTGKMAMSVSKDHTLKLWNLVQGRCAFTRRLKAPTEQVIWHEETGDYYLLVSAKDIQLFKASDNSILATLTHGSRITRACFTSVTAADGSGSVEYRMVTVCDNRTVNIFDFQGKQTACVDLSPLGAARPRDVYSADPNTSAVTNSDMLEVVQAAGKVLVVGTSLGQIIVLSVNVLEEIGVSTNADGAAVEGAGEEDEAALTVESAVLSNHQIRAEPRLTALVAWNPATAAQLYATKGSKRGKSMLASEDGPSTGSAGSVGSAEEVETDDDSVDEEEKEKVKVVKGKGKGKSTGKGASKEEEEKSTGKGRDASKGKESADKSRGASADAKGGRKDDKKAKFDSDRPSITGFSKVDSNNKRKAEPTSATSTNKKAARSHDSDDDGPAKVISFEDAYPEDKKGKDNKKGNNKNKNKNYAARKVIHNQK